MNILIIGGLLGIAVLAILGAVLLGIREERVAKAPAISPASTLPATPALTRATGQLPSLNEDERPVLRRTGQLVVPNEEERFIILQGQMHEITSELRSLAQKAGELEQRLNNLSEVIERQPYRPTEPTGQLYPARADTSSL